MKKKAKGTMEKSKYEVAAIVNPYTGRLIAVGGKQYNRLLRKDPKFISCA
jgi:hypothetical protein